MEVYFTFKIESEPTDKDVYATLSEALGVANHQWEKLAARPSRDYYPHRHNGTVTVFAHCDEDNESFAGCPRDTVIMQQDFPLKVEGP